MRELNASKLVMVIVVVRVAMMVSLENTLQNTIHSEIIWVVLVLTIKLLRKDEI